MNEKRLLGGLLAFAVFGYGCSLLLDTGSLQSGGPPSSDAGANSGAGSDAVADVAVEAGESCRGDFDCEGATLDSCNVNKCTPDHTCAPPKPYHGLAVFSEGNVETVFTADDVGYPSLLADGANFYLGVFRRDGAISNIELRRFPELANAGGPKADLTALAANQYEQFGSSPGLSPAGPLGGKLRLLFAGDPVGPAPMGMRVLDLDESSLKVAADQLKIDPAVTGYDAKPHGPAPRLFNNGDWALWVQNDKLFFFDGKTAAAPVFAAKKVLAFSPMIGLGGPYAVLETASAAGTDQATEIWALGNPSLFSLSGDESGTRRGVSASSFPENLLNVVTWSVETPTEGTLLKTNVAICLGTQCQAFAGVDTGPPLPASLPEVSSARVDSSNRDFVESFQITLAKPEDPSTASTLFLASAIRVTSVADAGADAGSLQSTNVNPQNFLIAEADGATSAPTGDVIGPTAVAITANDHLMAAWVERAGAGRALKTRRFAIKPCP